MKIIYVLADNDFDALAFESKYGTNPDIKLWNEIRENQILVVDDVDLNVHALEFGDVDPNFIGFVRTLIDYDSSKNTNFYVVNESLTTK